MIEDIIGGLLIGFGVFCLIVVALIIGAIKKSNQKKE